MDNWIRLEKYSSIPMIIQIRGIGSKHHQKYDRTPGHTWNLGFGTTVYHWFYKGVDALRMNRMNVQNDGKKQTPSEFHGAYTL